MPITEQEARDRSNPFKNKQLAKQMSSICALFVLLGSGILLQGESDGWFIIAGGVLAPLGLWGLAFLLRYNP